MDARLHARPHANRGWALSFLYEFFALKNSANILKNSCNVSFGEANLPQALNVREFLATRFQ